MLFTEKSFLTTDAQKLFHRSYTESQIPNYKQIDSMFLDGLVLTNFHYWSYAA